MVVKLLPENVKHMEHILDNDTGQINFDRYLLYLHSIQDRLPEHVYSFAANSGHHDLHSHSSLHDSWLEALTISEPMSGDSHQVRRMAIHIRLLGPYHDRRIHLHYTGVERYFLDAPNRNGMARFAHTAHGDLLVHEVRLGQNELIIHELQFERGGTMLIECRDMHHSEEMIGA